MIERTNFKFLMSPWVVMPISVFTSLIIYLPIAYIFPDLYHIGAVFLTIFIPGIISFTISKLMVQYHLIIKDQRNELEYLNKLNQRIFSTITHDIRSPISSVSMLIDLMVSETISVEECKTQLISVSSNIDILLQFLDELLVWSKQQIDKEPLKPEFFDTEHVINQTLKLYENIISGKKLFIRTGNLHSIVLADKGSYSFIIRNVIHNAIKFTQKNGEIQIRVLKDDYQVITEIKDTGIGINSETLDKILAKKKYSSTNGTSDEIGTGFGLKTALDYLEKQGGTLEINSAKNKGTRVLINLPTPNMDKYKPE